MPVDGGRRGRERGQGSPARTRCRGRRGRRSAAACGCGCARPAATGEFGQRSVGDQPSGDQHDDVVDGLGDFGQQMAGDHDGASRGGIAAGSRAASGRLRGRGRWWARPTRGSEARRAGRQRARGADASPARSRRRAAGRRRSRRRRRAPRRRDRRAGRRWRRGRAGAHGSTPGMEARRLEHGADVTDRFVEVAVGLTVDGRRAGRRGTSPSSIRRVVVFRRRSDREARRHGRARVRR